MKKLFLGTAVLAAATIFSFNSCTQKEIEKKECIKMENTIISLGFWQDSLNVDPAELLASIERINKAIDSIGYPDAGYKLWIVQSDTISWVRFLLNGNWPNQDLYDEIHDHELYKNAVNQDEILDKLINVGYGRFTRVK